jgi:hypothetical protein
MTFREITLGSASRQEFSLTPSLGLGEEDKPFFRSLMDNQSPIMKFWFIVMVLNLAMFLFIIH